ncbi:hypothetical protein C1H46_017328 [Malus baccata]|uniref:Calcineurin-like phosphoesterase domain-containing protein n=1 Tax=Malus baccata TaxID=106549 RepID=A0A540ME50_MALBA|nr:hypothetical protein C1H46_017328 [Malus baccata]
MLVYPLTHVFRCVETLSNGCNLEHIKSLTVHCNLVNGNHETINVEGDFRFVDTGGFDECLDFLEYLDDNRDDWEEAFVGWVGVSKRMKEERKTPQNYWDPWNLVRVLKSTVSLIILFPSLFRNVSSDKVFRILGQKQKGVIARSILLRPGGPLACELARHAVVLKVNDWVFCHGGLVPQHVAYGVERMNREVSDWMRGLVESDDNASLSSPPSPPRDVTTLQAVGAKGRVVGHTPQPTGANCEYDCSIWRIDVGMSSGVLNSRPEVLEIKDNKARVIRSKKDPSSELMVVDYI